MFYRQSVLYQAILYELAFRMNLFHAFLFGFSNFLTLIVTNAASEVVSSNQINPVKYLNLFFLCH